MLKTIEGVYHDGKIELLEVPQDIQEEMFVLVTFLPSKKNGTFIDLAFRGIDRVHAYKRGMECSPVQTCERVVKFIDTHLAATFFQSFSRFWLLINRPGLYSAIRKAGSGRRYTWSRSPHPTG